MLMGIQLVLILCFDFSGWEVVCMASVVHLLRNVWRWESSQTADVQQSSSLW